jgi:thiamine biosynthesis protein ThiS
VRSLEVLRVYINGESRELTGTPSLAELITQLDLPAARVAVELNRNVVRRSEWGSTVLHEDDRIEIVHFVGGGFSVQPLCLCGYSYVRKNNHRDTETQRLHREIFQV